MIAATLPLLAALLLHTPAVHAGFPGLDIVETSTQATLDARALEAHGELHTSEPQVYYRHLMNFAGRSLADASFPSCGSTADCTSGNRCVSGFCRPCGAAAQRACEVNGALQCNDGFEERNGFCFTAFGGLFNFNIGGGTNTGVTAGEPPITPGNPAPAPPTTPPGVPGTVTPGVYGPPPTVPPPAPPPVVPVVPPPVVPPPSQPGAPPVTDGPSVVPLPPDEDPNGVDPDTAPGRVPPRVIVIIVRPEARARPSFFSFSNCGAPGSPCCITVYPFISSAYCFGGSTCQTDTLFPSCEATPGCQGIQIGNTCNTFF